MDPTASAPPETSEKKRRQRPCRRYPCALYVRATAAEKRRIAALAKGAHLSASRYLVRLALEGRAPPGEQEREALLSLRWHLEKVGNNLNQIAHRANRAWLLGEPPLASLTSELDAVLKGVRILSREIRKRL